MGRVFKVSRKMNTEFAVLVMDNKEEADKVAGLSNQEFLEHFLQSDFRVRLEDVVVERPEDGNATVVQSMSTS
jgi:uncharacterized membrane protein